MNAKAISDKPKSAAGCGRVLLFLFGAIFFLAGCGACWALLIHPWNQARRARGWPEHPCRILTAEVESHTSDDGTSYSPNIRYQYSLDGKDFVSERYTFTELSSGHGWAQKIVARYPAGTDTVCYYDPDDPAMAVLKREFSGREFWFGLLFPTVFMGVGGGILFFGFIAPLWRGSSRSTARQSATQLAASEGLPLDVPTDFSLRSPTDSETDDSDEFAAFEGPQKLKISESRWGKAIVIAIFCVFWNGIVSIFLYQALFGNKIQFWLLLFLSPFVLVGTLMLVALVHQVLSLANPTVEIALSNGAVAPGESIDVAWQLSGRVNRIRRLTVRIEGKEKATYTRGTSTVTDTNVFRTIELAQTEDPDEISFGTRELTIPPDTIHSFKSNNNEIEWTIHVAGSIPWWPDIDDRFEFKVKPATPSHDPHHV